MADQATLAVLQQAVNALQTIATTLGKVFPQSIGTTTTATAGSATLPAAPVGFLEVINPATGATIKVPYYV